MMKKDQILLGHAMVQILILICGLFKQLKMPAKQAKTCY
jgi:hypothetical protein